MLTDMAARLPIAPPPPPAASASGVFFILAVDQPPQPDVELLRVVATCDGRGCAWLGVKNLSFPKAARGSGGLVFAKATIGLERWILVAKKTGYTTSLPEDAPERELYDGHGYVHFVRIEEAVLARGQVRADSVPGVFGDERRPFASHFSRPMAWVVDDVTDTAEIAARIVEPVPATARLLPPQIRKNGRDSAASPPVASPAHRPGITVAAAPVALPMPASNRPLFGVDWSGSAQTSGRNDKLWVASLRGDQVALEWGRDGFVRSDIAQRIMREGGLWVLDFPFGVPASVAAALGLDPDDWTSWMRWVEETLPPFNATALRDLARLRVAAAGGEWSALRNIDVQLRTTWFPLFEQLYRQTLTGAHEILGPCSRQPDLAIAPLMPVTGRERTLVVEGFPGGIIRDHLGLVPTGYKKKTALAEAHRRAILAALQDALQVDLEPILERAVADPEGDAVDALVLLLAARRAAEFSPDAWARARADLVAHRRLLEGWFPN